MIKISIIDDDEYQLERMRLILGGGKDFSVVSVYTSAEEALRRLPEDAPMVVLTDIRMPVMDGVDFIKKGRELLPQADFIALTAMEDDDTIERALRAGAMGYILKSEPPAQICEMLSKVMNGAVPLSSKVAKCLIKNLNPGQATPNVNLTPRERQILMDIEEGYTYKETAARLGVSVHTIHNQVRGIFEKLGVNNKMEALKAAHKMGLF